MITSVCYGEMTGTQNRCVYGYDQHLDKRCTEAVTDADVWMSGCIISWLSIIAINGSNIPNSPSFHVVVRGSKNRNTSSWFKTCKYMVSLTIQIMLLTLFKLKLKLTAWTVCNLNVVIKCGSLSVWQFFVCLIVYCVHKIIHLN